MSEERVVLTASLRDEMSTPIDNLKKKIDGVSKSVEASNKKTASSTKSAMDSVGGSIDRATKKPSALGRAFDTASGRIRGAASTAGSAIGKGISGGVDKAVGLAKAGGSRIGNALMSPLGLIISAAAVGATFKNAFSALQEQEVLAAQTSAVIRSTGGAAGVSADHITKLSEKLEGMNAVEKESIREGANFLLTFKNIANQAGAGNDIFDQTTQAMTDLARATGTDMQSASLQLGKALNDPTKGMAALNRVGITFTAQQKDQVKALQSSGDMLGAQKVILAELESQFGGSGAAFAATGAGAVYRMKDAWGDLFENIVSAAMPAIGVLSNLAVGVLGLITNSGGLESFGAKLAGAATGLTNWVNAGGAAQVVQWFQGILPIISPVGTVLAAMGKVAGESFAQIGTALGQMLPVLAPVLTYLIQAATAIITFVTPILPILIPAILMTIAVMRTWAIVQGVLNAVMMANPVGIVILGIMAFIAAVVLAYNNVGWFKDGVNAVFAFIGTVISNLVSFWQTNVYPAVLAIGEWFAGMGRNVQATIQTAIAIAIVLFTRLTDWWNGTLGPIIDSVVGWFRDKIGAGIDAVAPYIQGALDNFGKLTDFLNTTLGPAADYVSGLFGAVGDAISTAAGAVGDFMSNPLGGLADMVGLSGGGVIQGGGMSGGGVIHAAGGALVKGYAPGKDRVPAMLSPGEGVAVPELVRAIGAKNFMALNSAFSGGRPAGAGPKGGPDTGAPQGGGGGGGTTIIIGDGAVQITYAGNDFQNDKDDFRDMVKGALEEVLHDARTKGY